MAIKRILIADDNRFIRVLVRAALEPLGCELFEAVDGADVLRAIDEERPDLVLLDVVMPKLSGFDVLDRLNGDPDAYRPRIAMLTVAGSKADIEQAKDLGVAGYIVKPFQPADLREKVSALLDS